MLLLTIAIVSLLFIISYLIFDKDLLAPPTVVAMVMLFGCICCCYNEKTWGIEFSYKSFFLISGGIATTMAGGLIGAWLSNFPKLRSFAFSHIKTEPQEIHVNGIKTWVIIIFQIVTLIFVYMHIRKLTGLSDLSLAVSKYRTITAGQNVDANDRSIWMPVLTKNMSQFSNMIAVIYAYIVGNNLIASKRKLSLNWLPIILFAITIFIQGDRSCVIRLWLIIVVTAYTIHRRSVGWRKSRETIKIIKKLALSVVAVGVGFSLVRHIVGRTDDWNMLYYVTFYAGCPIAGLNQMWEAPITKPDIFGKRTLFYLNQSMHALFGWPELYNYYSPFRKSPTGVHIGNVATAIGRPYEEFGFWGFILFMMAMGAFFTFLYCKCRKKRGNSPIDIHLVIYAYISYVFFMYFYAPFFDFLTHVFIKFIIEFLIIRWGLVGWQFKGRILFTLNSERTFRCRDLQNNALSLTEQ